MAKKNQSDLKPTHCTIQQAANRFGMSVERIRSMIEAGEIRAASIGTGTQRKAWRVEIASLDLWMAARTNQTSKCKSRPKRSTRQYV